MNEQCRKKRHSKVFLVFAATMVLGGGLCLAGKPGGGGSQNTSLSTVIEQSLDEYTACGLCPVGGAYINGKDGVRSLFLGDGAYGFTSNYQRSKTGPRKVNLKGLGAPISEDVVTLPIHLALDWNVRDLAPDKNGMGGAFSYSGVDYNFRWGSADPFKADPLGKADGVRVTKTNGEWVIESTGGHMVRLVVYDRWLGPLDKGLHRLPFKLTLTDLSTSAQKAVTPEDIFTWSPQGDRIAMVASDPNGDHTIQVIDLQTGSVLGEYGRGILTSAPRGLVWANRSEMLSFSANNDDGQETVFVVNLRNGRLMEIGLGSAPKWAPNDSRLIFLSEGGISVFDLNRRAVVTVPRNSLN